MTIIFRKYNSNDYVQMKHNLQIAGLYDDRCETKELIERLVTRDSESIIIAEDDAKIVGSIYFNDMGFICMCWRLNVIPEYRKKGLGKRLIEKTKILARKRGFKQIHFVVDEEQNGLIDFYKTLGAWEYNSVKWMGFDL